MIRPGVDRFISLKESDTRKVFDSNTRRYQNWHNVGGLHELQRCELRGWHFAVRFDYRWQYRKLVARVWNDLYSHEESPGPSKSVIRHGQSNSELASTGESGQTLTSLIFSSLSCALSSKPRETDDTAESHTKSQTSNHEVRISGKHEQSFFTSTDAARRRVNISSDYNPLTPEIQESNANTSYPVEAARLKYVQKLLKREIEEAAADVLQPRDSDGITYIPAKETNQTGDGIRHEFLNVSRISESPAVTEPAAREEEDEETKKTEDKLKEGSWAGSLNNAGVKTNMPKSLGNAKSNTPQQVKILQEWDDGVRASVDSNIGDTSKAHLAENSNDGIVKTQNAAPKADNQTLGGADQESWKSEEDGLMEAANFGLQAMNDLYYIQEPKLYSMGLYLENDNPARYVAAFNDQSEEARGLARFGYAALQGTAVFLKKFPNTPLELPLSRSKLTRRSSLEQQCPRRDPPRCPRASLRYRTSDGSCNNLQNLWWGSAMSAMRRFLSSEYEDGVQSVRRSRDGRPLPSARDVTSLIHENKDVPLASITHMLMQWGQFVDHDLTATGQSRGFNGTIPQCCLQGGVGFQPPEFMHPECLPIAVNLRDNFYGPLGVRCLEFLRSGPAPKEGCEFGPRDQLSQVTSYLDASMVYSSNAMHSDSLRLFRNGLLQYGRIQSRRPSLLKRESDLCKRGSLSTTCFRAGDGRLSEQPALTSLHVVFLRLHNRIATELSVLNSHWSDEKLFQETRRLVGAVVQHITYREFLPIVLGPQVMKIFDLEVLKKGYYEGYDPTVNPTIANSFSTAAYRFGHSLVQRSFVRFDSDHRPIFNNVSIHDEFSNPANLDTAGSVDRLLLGLVNQPCQRRDEFMSEEVTNHLFQTPGFAFGMDLASINIQRGRDHGLPPYVRWREPCALSPIKTFEDLDRVMSRSVSRKFKSLYSSVEDIDLFSAGLAEKSVVGGLVGPTFACIIAQQFSNLRRGDRFWYENPDSESSFTAGQLQQIRQVSLAQVLCRMMDDIKTIQPFVFLAADMLKNKRLSCDDPAIGHLDLELWAERPSEFKDDVDNSQKVKRTATEKSSSVPRPKKENVSHRRRVSSSEHTKSTTPKPFQNSVNQENNIVVKKPFGRPDNLTIVVQNNAVNAPVFVNEGIYGSRIKIQGQPSARPSSNLNHALINHLYRPQGRPIPTTIPHSPSIHLARHPYVPYSFRDPHNPNPLAYGYRSPAFAQDDVFYDNYSGTSPTPTLYTYYTNFQKASTTQKSEIDGYLINGLLYHDLPPAHAYERPKFSENFGHYALNDEQKLAQRPNYGGSEPPTNIRLTRPSYESSDEFYTSRPNYDGHKPSTSTRPNSQPSYAPNDESYQTHRPSYDGHKPSTTARPSSQLIYVINNDSHHTHRPSYDGHRPLTTTRPHFRPNYASNDESYHAHRPSYDGHRPPTTTLPNSRPNYASNEPYPTHKPSYDGQRPSTTTRPNSRPNFELNDEPYNGPDYNRPKPPGNSRPNDNLHHAQKPTYNGFTSPTNLRPDRPNREPYGVQKPGDVGNFHSQNDDLINRPNGGYPASPNKPQHQGQWSSNDYRKRPGEKLYDYDDPDAYRKKPSIKPPSYSTDDSHQISSSTRPGDEYSSQFWKKDPLHFIKGPVQDGLHGSVPISGTNAPSYQKVTLVDSSASSSANDHERYSATPIYQKVLSSTQSSWTDVSPYMKEGGTRPPFSKDPFHSSHPLHQRPTSHSTYQKDDQSELSSKVSVDKRPVAADSYEHDSYKNPTEPLRLNEQLLSSTPYSSETSTIGAQIYKQEENPKPTKVQSVTIVSETIETVQHPGHSGYIPQHKVTSEIPRPLAQQIRSNVPATKKAGQYYYEKNVLHRYPGEVVDQIPKSNHHLTGGSEETSVRDRETTSERTSTEVSVIDDPATSSQVNQRNESKLTTTPTRTITDHDNRRSDVVDDLQRAFSADIESAAPADVPGRTNHWLNLQEDLNSSSTLEIPAVPSDESANAEELPKPIKSRSHAT
ncbi:PREDICTED: uncharacterized protein LOC105561494 isoform X2 [Vollenhovia emeryi]|uniref:uncharacterized protein LOC105561494 isoform X2 n=1 Tax=Vollenhovia emeryi TaxID=411798 RepID=UPI0005F544B9|nr:PREDICTED: uncharacterized protein LOC105561494 isoform X2 [Vollenhovia emeryi]